MKYLNKSIYAFALVGMAGLWSCSQEDVLQGGDVTASGHPVPVTLTVNRGDAQTRTVLSENTATGGLNDVWEEGDKLAVYNSDGAKAGELVITDGVGEDTGVFTGVITSENGQYDFNLWYTDPVATGAKEADGKPLYFNSKNEMVVDLSKMPKYTTVEDLSAMDILSKKVKLNIKDNNATLVQDEKMVAHLAMARFSLNGIPAGETGKLTIKNNGASTDGILYKQRLSLASSSVEGTVSRPEGIVINDVNPGEDIYLAFIPQTYTLSFTFESEKDTYNFSFANSTKLEGGVYYSAFTKEEGAEEGEFNGVNIPLVGTPIAELHLHANFSGADPEEIVIYKKFENGEAYFDLSQSYDYYVGTNGQKLPARDGYTFIGWSEQENSTAWDCKAITISSPSHLSADVNAIWEKNADVDHSKNPLLKWAETNLVFNTSTRTSTFATSPYDSGSLYQWGRNDGYSDYKDAMGAIGSQGNYSYGTYQGTYSAGEGWINKSSGTNRGSLNYTSASEIQQVTAAKRMYFINPYSGYDYWPFANGGNSWETRAKACNYSSESPAPTNWRLPKKSDLIEIYPTEGYNWSGTNNLADNVNGKLVEIKKISGVCTYAIRWDVETYSGKKILKIKALVVPDSYENNATDINKVDWSDSNVVERIFPATGAIEAYVHTHTNSQYQTLNVVRPIPFGNWNVSILGYPSLTNSRYWCVQYSNIVDAAKTEEGAYWISDEKMIFRFRNNNGQFGSNNTSSFFGTSNQPTSNAFAIRCVRDN